MEPRFVIVDRQDDGDDQSVLDAQHVRDGGRGAIPAARVNRFDSWTTRSREAASSGVQVMVV